MEWMQRCGGGGGAKRRCVGVWVILHYLKDGGIWVLLMVGGVGVGMGVRFVCMGAGYPPIGIKCEKMCASVRFCYVIGSVWVSDEMSGERGAQMGKRRTHYVCEKGANGGCWRGWFWNVCGCVRMCALKCAQKIGIGVCVRVVFGWLGA